MNGRNTLPDGWEVVPLGSIIADLKAGVSVNGEDRPAGDGELGVLKVSAVSEGRFLPQENKAVIPADRDRVAVSPHRGDVLVSRANGSLELVGANVYVETDHPKLFLPDLLWRITTDNSRNSSRWLHHVLGSPIGRRSIETKVAGSNGTHKLSQASFRSIEVPRPPRPEQDRIAAILSTWSKAEEHCTALLDAKMWLRAGIVTRLLERDGQPTRLGDVVEESRLRNNGLVLGQDTVRAVNKVEGMIPMKENVIGSSLDRYKVVRKDWFAYNPMRLNIGSIARWREDRAVLVSPDYVVLRCRDGLLDPDYLDHLRRSPRWERFVEEAGNGSVRVRIYYADLTRLRVPLPPLAEQRRIATVLNTLDREITLLRDYLEALKKQKRGLMQLLLTGKLRVRTE